MTRLPQNRCAEVMKEKKMDDTFKVMVGRGKVRVRKVTSPATGNKYFAVEQYRGKKWVTLRTDVGIPLLYLESQESEAREACKLLTPA